MVQSIHDPTTRGATMIASNCKRKCYALSDYVSIFECDNSGDVTFMGSSRDGVPFTMVVNKEDFVDFCNDEKVVQDCFPYLTNDERELLLTGFTTDDWDELFGDISE